MYNEKYLKTKIKSHNGIISTNFHNNKIQEEGSQLIYWTVILINSIFKANKNYYPHPQVFLEEHKYVVKKKVPKYIIDDIEISSDSDRENSHEENFYEENSDKENSTEENFDEENLKNTNITNKNFS